MSRACGLSVSTVQRSGRAFGLQPHRLRPLSFLPLRSRAKVRDAIGLYLAALAQTVALGVDERSDRIQDHSGAADAAKQRGAATTTPAMPRPRSSLSTSPPGSQQQVLRAPSRDRVL